MVDICDSQKFALKPGIFFDSMNRNRCGKHNKVMSKAGRGQSYGIKQKYKRKR